MNKIIILICTLFYYQILFGQWSTDPTKNLRVTNMGMRSTIISDDAGGAYITYNDIPSIDVHIHVQRLDKYGYRKFPGNGIMIVDSSQYQYFDYFVINDNHGGLIVVFDNLQVIENGVFRKFEYRTYAQRIDSIGNKLWGEKGTAISPESNESIMSMNVCSDGEGGCYVFWGNYYSQNHIDFRVQHLDSQGNFMWDSCGVLITDNFTSYNSTLPCLTITDGEGGTIFHYFDSTGAKLQRLDSEANFLWENGIKPFPHNWHWINMKEDGCSGVILAGVYRTYNEEDSSKQYNVEAQRIDRDGNALWGDEGVLITDLATSRTVRPKIVVDKFGNSIIVWRGGHNSNFDYVYAQRLNSIGKPKWEENGICMGGKSVGYPAEIVADDEGGAVIIWEDIRLLPSRVLYAQNIDCTGKNKWYEDILISLREINYGIEVISDGNGGAIVCWDEYPPPGFVIPDTGIYVQQISRNGNLGEVLETFVRENDNFIIPMNAYLFQSYPNPFNSKTVIKYKIPKLSKVRINIYDLTGKEVINLINKNQNPGEYQLIWNGKNQKGIDVSSGTYLIQLESDNFVQTRRALLIK